MSPSLRILVTCCGRRNQLIRCFQEAFDLLGIRGEVHASDASDQAPGLAWADEAFLTPPLDHPDHLSTLLDHCRRASIDLLFSLYDLELMRLAEAREAFAAVGTRVVVSRPGVIAIASDKLETYRFCRDHGIPTAETFATLEACAEALTDGRATWPLVVKPRWGSGSIGVARAHTWEELELFWEVARLRAARSPLRLAPGTEAAGTVLAQATLPGREFGMDVLNDLEGRFLGSAAREKVVMRAGETDRAITRRLPALEALALTLSRTLGHVGNLDCDTFVDGDRVALLELNPRFGGGYPFSHLAGAQFPAALLATHLGLPVDPAWLNPRPDVPGSKYDQVLSAHLTGACPAPAEAGACRA